MIQKYISFLLVAFVIILSSCNTSKTVVIPPKWEKMSLAKGVETYVDINSIKHEELVSYATEKRVYTTLEAKNEYLSKIRDKWAKLGSPKKADKWNDCSYSIYKCVYECTNKRCRILSIEDYDSTGNIIARTTPNEKVIKWSQVDKETIGDYNFFFICDYE